MLHNGFTYDLNFCFKVITLVFLAFLLLVNNVKGGLSMMFFEGGAGSSSNSENIDITIFSFPNVFILILLSFVLTLFMHVLGLSFFSVEGLFSFFLDAFTVLILLLIKVFMVFMSSYVLDEHNLFKVFDKEFLSYMSFMSLVCLVLVFVGLNYDLTSNTSLLFVIILMQILWYFRLSYVLLQSTTFNFLYFFSYLCSLEILPTLAVATYVGII